MIEGTLIAESLRIGTSLQNLDLTVRKISRYRVPGATPDQPGIWSVLDFTADEGQADRLAQTFADVLEQPGWYVNFEAFLRISAPQPEPQCRWVGSSVTNTVPCGEYVPGTDRES